MGCPRSSCGALLLLLLCCRADRTMSQEDSVAAASAPSCYGAGSIATAVIVTFLLSALLLAAISLWWKRYKSKEVSNHLILETDPEKGKGEYAFDNPGFKDATLSAIKKQPLEAEKNDLPKSKWQQWTPLTTFTVKSERRKALDDSAIEGNQVKVISLKSHDFTGLGFNICGNMKEGIFVKDVLQRGPASESGKLNSGDRIHSVTISFEHMVYEDALTILGYASPYEVTIEATSGKLTLTDQGGQPSHPIYRSSSWSDLYRVVKSSKRQLFSEDINESNSTYSSLQKPRSNVTTLERKESKSPKLKQPCSKKPSAKPDVINTTIDSEAVQKLESKHQKFGVRVLPLEIQQKSPKIIEQNENNINIEKHQLDLGAASLDEVDEPKKPPPVKRREKKQPEAPETFERNSLNGSGIKRTKEGIPLELPAHMLNAASAALRNRGDDDTRSRRKGRAPAVPTEEPATTEYNSDSDAEDNCSSVNTIELNATDITVHQVEDEQLQSRKTLSAGDLSQMRHQVSPIATLERAQSLDISDRPLDDEVLHGQPRLSLVLDGLSTFERNRLKKSSEWGDLEDAVLPDQEFDAIKDDVEDDAEQLKVENQIWPSFDAQLNETIIPKSVKPAVLIEETIKKPPPPPEKPLFRKIVNNRIDEPFEAARSYNSTDNLFAQADTFSKRIGDDKLPKSKNSTKFSNLPEDLNESAPSDPNVFDIARYRNSHEKIAINDNTKSFTPVGFPENEENTSKDPVTVDILPHTRGQDKIASEEPKPIDISLQGNSQKKTVESDDTDSLAKSHTVESSEVDNKTASNDLETIDNMQRKRIQDETVSITSFKSPTVGNVTASVEAVVAKNKTASKDSETVEVVLDRRDNGFMRSYTSTEFSVEENDIAANESDTVDGIPSRDEEAVKSVSFAESYTSSKSPVVKNRTDAKESETVLVPLRSREDETVERNDTIKSYTSIEFSEAENKTAPNDAETVVVVPPRNSSLKTMTSHGLSKSYTSIELPEVEDKTTSDDPETMNEVPHRVSQDKIIINNFSKSSSYPIVEDESIVPHRNNQEAIHKPSEVSIAEAKTASTDSETSHLPLEKTTKTKSYTSFDIPMNENRTSRRQRVPEPAPPEPTRLPTKPAEVLSKIPLLNSMVESQRKEGRVGNLTDETKNIVTLNTVPDLLDLTQNFLHTEQLSSYSYGPHTNVPDDIKVSRHSKESSKHVSNVNVSNGNAELHSLELSINENSEPNVARAEGSLKSARLNLFGVAGSPNGRRLNFVGAADNATVNSSNLAMTARSGTEEVLNVAEAADRPKGNSDRSSTPTYVTEIQVTTHNTGSEENELERIKEIAERQLKKLPEMRFTTSSYEHSRLPEKRPSTVEHLRSNFEKPKLTRQESSSSLKSRIPIATVTKTPPTSPERRDSRHLDTEHDQAILELMSKPQVKAASKNVTVTSIRSGSKIPSGLPTLGGGRSPPKRVEGSHGTESGFKQWVFNPSNVTNVVVTDNKRE